MATKGAASVAARAGYVKVRMLCEVTAEVPEGCRIRDLGLWVPDGAAIIEQGVNAEGNDVEAIGIEVDTLSLVLEDAAGWCWWDFLNAVEQRYDMLVTSSFSRVDFRDGNEEPLSDDQWYNVKRAWNTHGDEGNEVSDTLHNFAVEARQTIPAAVDVDEIEYGVPPMRVVRAQRLTVGQDKRWGESQGDYLVAMVAEEHDGLVLIVCEVSTAASEAGLYDDMRPLWSGLLLGKAAGLEGNLFDLAAELREVPKPAGKRRRSAARRDATT